MFENCEIGLKDKNGVGIKCGDTLEETFQDPDEGEKKWKCKVVYCPDVAAFMMEENERGKKYYTPFLEGFESKYYEVVNV